MVPDPVEIIDENQRLLAQVNIVLDKLTSEQTVQTPLEQLGLLIAVRRKLSEQTTSDDEMTEKIKQICNKTGLVEFIKHCGSHLMADS